MFSITAIVLILLVLTGIESEDHHYGDCTEDAVDECWEGMEQHQGDFDSPLVPIFTDGELESVCNSYKRVRQCMDHLIDDCHSLEQDLFQGIDDAWHFICDEQREEYLEHRVCFDDARLQKEGNKCADHFYSNLKDLEDEPFDFTNILDRTCQYINNYLDCVENAVKSFCGEEAASWQRELDFRSMEPFISNTGCELDETGHIVKQVRPSTESSADGDTDGTRHSAVPKSLLIAFTVILTLLLLILGVAIFIKIKLTQRLHTNNNPSGVSTNGNSPNNTPTIQSSPEVGVAMAVGVSHDPLPEKIDNFDDTPPRYSSTVNSPVGECGPEYTAAVPSDQPPPYEGFPTGNDLGQRNRPYDVASDNDDLTNVG